MFPHWEMLDALVPKLPPRGRPYGVRSPNKPCTLPEAQGIRAWLLFLIRIFAWHRCVLSRAVVDIAVILQ